MDEFQVSDDEAVALVVSAYREVVLNQVSRPLESNNLRPSLVDWRFSGRWWSGPIVARRARPL